MTATQPVSPYGFAKLDQEGLVATWAEATQVRTIVGRLANLYGPGQNVAKPQGLISQLVLSTLLRRPTSIYVPLDTMRDYLYVDDAGTGCVADCCNTCGATRTARWSPRSSPVSGRSRSGLCSPRCAAHSSATHGSWSPPHR